MAIRKQKNMKKGTILSNELTNEQLITKFIRCFYSTHLYKDLEIRVSAKEVREFLTANKSSLSFNRFNKMTGCSGITSHNLYSYSVVLLILLSSEPVEVKRPLKAYPSDWIYCISCFGTKKDFRKEWSKLLVYTAEDLGCEHLVDAFAGSGFISLLASKLGLFKSILQNDASTELFNYYCVMKDEVKFSEFINLLSTLPPATKEAFSYMREKFYHLDRSKDKRKNKTIAGREIKRQLWTVDATRAAWLFWFKHYSVVGSGGLSTCKFHLKYYVDALKSTHKLYDRIEVKNLLYQNAIRNSLGDEKSLIVLDAPYFETVRTEDEAYSVEFSKIEKHLKMLKMVKNADARIIICGYIDSENTYTNYLNKHSMKTWHCVKFKRLSKLSKYQEHIWINFDIEQLVSQNGEDFELVY